MTYWQRWIRQPQSVWLRKAFFQLHLWSGIGLGLYVFFISVTGSVLVFRNELYVAATPDRVFVTDTGTLLTDDQLRAAATRVYPGYTVQSVSRSRNPAEAVDIFLKSKTGVKSRHFNPYTGADLGDMVPLGIRLISRLGDLHDDLLGGNKGRKVNGYGGLMVVLMALTGMVVWWPGIKTWKRGLTVQRNVGWQRFIWGLHSMIGFWTLLFTVIFGLSGLYLGDPQPWQDLADRITPPTLTNAGVRFVDKFIYWLAYLHFGRICGIGIPCKGPGLCDMTTKSLWALFGLAPAAMFVTGAMMWWFRVVRKKLKRMSEPALAQPRP